jgi:hypothetical protein
MPPTDALIVVLPTLLPVAVPALVTVATLVLAEAQVAAPVKLAFDPSE